MFYTAKKGNKKIIRPLIAVLAIAASFEVANAFTVDADMPAGNIIVEKIDGAACPPSGSVTKFQNGAFDGDVTGLPAGTVTGTAAEFFKDYANGDYAPKTGGRSSGRARTTRAWRPSISQATRARSAARSTSDATRRVLPHSSS